MSRMFYAFILLLCVSGFIIQLSFVSDRYFKYETGTVSEHFIPKSIRLPFVSACFRINDVLNYTKVRSVYDRPGLILWKEGVVWRWFYDHSADFSVTNWFNFTPAVQDFFYSDYACHIKTKYSSFDYDGKGCLKESTIVKYFEREFVCYRFEPKTDKAFDMVLSTMSPGSAGILYEIYLNPDIFKDYEYVSMSIHSKDSSMLYDTISASSFKLSGNDHYKFDIRYKEFQIHRKSYPYDTNCVEIVGGHTTGAEHQLDWVNRETMARMNMVSPFVPTYNSSYNYRIFSPRKFQDKLNSYPFDKIFLSQPKELIECKTKYHINTARGKMGSDMFTMTVNWPQDGLYRVTYVARYELIEYFIFIGSCVGCYVGIFFMFAYRYIRSSMILTQAISGQSSRGGSSKKKRESDQKIMKLEEDMKTLRIQVEFLKNVCVEIIE